MTTQSPFNPAELPTRAEVEETDYLPSINLIQALTPDVNLRAAYSATVSRPDYRELTPFSLADYQSSYEIQGNPLLNRARIRNVDLRLEYFPPDDPGEVFAVSLFYKDLNNPIVSQLFAGSDLVEMPVNGEDGDLYGAEFEARMGLGRVSQGLNRFGMSANLTLVHSLVKLAEEKGGIQTSDEHPLQGQSPYVFNAGLYYSGGSLSSSLLYNVFGKRLSDIGGFGLPDIYEQPAQSLDFQMSHSLYGARVKFSAENLLDEDMVFKQAEATTYRVHRGRSVGVSLGYGSH